MRRSRASCWRWSGCRSASAPSRTKTRACWTRSAGCASRMPTSPARSGRWSKRCASRARSARRSGSAVVCSRRAPRGSAARLDRVARAQHPRHHPRPARPVLLHHGRVPEFALLTLQPNDESAFACARAGAARLPAWDQPGRVASAFIAFGVHHTPSARRRGALHVQAWAASRNPRIP